jgi:subtilisin family serine protease
MMSKALSFIIVVSLAVLTIVAYALSADSPQQKDFSPPTFYIYGGQELQMDLGRSRIAVQFLHSFDETERAETVARSGIKPESEVYSLSDDWYLYDLSEGCPDKFEVADRINSALSLEGVTAVSPVFDLPDDGWLIIPSYVLLRFKPEYVANSEALLSSLAPDFVVIERNFGGMSGAYRLMCTSGDGFRVLSRANELAGNEQIKWAEPDIMESRTIEDVDSDYTLSDEDFNKSKSWFGRDDFPDTDASAKFRFVPNDPDFPLQWHLKNTGQLGGVPGMDTDAENAWDITEGDSNIIVAIMDLGIQQDHPDINQLPGKNFCSDSLTSSDGGPVNDCDNHGTPVAGCISAIINNSLGLAGIAPKCKVISARIGIAHLACDNSFSSAISWRVNALDWAETQGAKISNHSYHTAYSSAVEDKLAETYLHGMTHFGAAGNDAQEALVFPASSAVVNAVSAITAAGMLANFSNYDSALSVSAPGAGIWTTDRTGSAGYSAGDYVLIQGTSFASPIAAGVAALILSVEPTLTPPEVEAKLHCSARDLGDPGQDKYYGYGVVNAYRAVVAPIGTDSDGDGTDDPCDNCPAISNADQADADGDGIGDACDDCPYDWYDDWDGDGYCAEQDNCPYIYNPGQEDINSDGIGDVCECSEANFTFTGSAPCESAGYRVRYAGDVNNDGFTDIAIAEPDYGGNCSTIGYGRVQVYSGDDHSLMYTFNGDQLGDEFGDGVEMAGDINDDGYDDVIIGAGALHFPVSGFGNEAYIFLGGPGPFPTTQSVSQAERTMAGDSPEDNFGSSVCSMPDIDGDSIPEVAVGAPQVLGGGAGYVRLFSGLSGAVLHTFSGEAAGDQFGLSIADAGDVDNDGTNDIVIGAPGNDNGGTEAGCVYVYSGSDYSELFRFEGSEGDDAGFSVSGAGDVNNDSYDDVIVGAPTAITGSEHAGIAIVYSGQTGDALYTLGGLGVSAYFGSAVASAGDVDLDGYADFVVGASGTIDVFVPSVAFGIAYLYSGQTGQTLQSFVSEEITTMFGFDLCCGSDLNNDGVNDLLIGDNVFSGNALFGGKVYSYYLGDPDGDLIPTGCDNCPDVNNPDQSDANGNGIGDACDYVCGDADGSGAVDIDDVVYLIAYIFSAGPAPDPLEAGDADCSGGVDIDDAVYLITYIFAGGNSPCDTDGDETPDC